MRGMQRPSDNEQRGTRGNLFGAVKKAKEKVDRALLRQALVEQHPVTLVSECG